MSRPGILLLAAGLLSAGGLAWWLASSTPRPNVLLITLDTTRADRLGCYGRQSGTTPHLDELARQGVIFEHAYAPAPLTLPSHTTMFTGLYPPEHGVRNNGEAGLAADIPTLATHLKADGYATGAFVGAFVLDDKFGLSRGFDVYNDELPDADVQREGMHAYRPGEQVIDAALKWLPTVDRRPFFGWVHLFDPHYPYLDHADRYGDEYRDHPYDAEIRYVDEQVGRLLHYLHETGQDQRTIIIVVGDHGEALGDHGERTHSLQLYNSTLHVPFIVSAPAISQPGRRLQTAVSLVDLSPTLLDYLGLEALPETSGRSLKAAFTGTEPDARRIYAETEEPYRVGHWSPLRAIYQGRWKYIRTPQAELYDLASDGAEHENQLLNQPVLAQQLREELVDWEAGMIRRQADRPGLTEAERAKIRSLGYVSGASMVAIGPDDTLPDVKDKLPIYHELEDLEALIEHGQFEAAVEPLQRLVAVDEDYSRARAYLGLCLLQLQRTRDAIGHLRRSVELDPTAARVQGMLGAALLTDGQYTAALEPLETALRLDDSTYQSHFNLARALEALNRLDEAAEHYRACLELAPDYEPARQRYEALQSK